jgi:hypothetical protein
MQLMLARALGVPDLISVSNRSRAIIWMAKRTAGRLGGNHGSARLGAMTIDGNVAGPRLAAGDDDARLDLVECVVGALIDGAFDHLFLESPGPDVATVGRAILQSSRAFRSYGPEQHAPIEELVDIMIGALVEWVRSHPVAPPVARSLVASSADDLVLA